MSDATGSRTATVLLAGGIIGAGATIAATTLLRDTTGGGSSPPPRFHSTHEASASLWRRALSLLGPTACKPSDSRGAAPRDKLRAAAEARAAVQHSKDGGAAGLQGSVNSRQAPTELHAPAALANVPANASGQAHGQEPAQQGDCGSNAMDDEILAEHFTRNTQFFGRKGQARVAASFVVVVGLGGVGSHAAAMLLRSGVQRLRLIDFDQVTLSSLNRHAVATRADVGLPKATVLAAHFRDIVPEAKIEARVEMYTAEAEASLLAGQPDFVLDAIDNINTKVSLLAACKRRGIPVLCCAGAGAKADPTRLRITDVAESSADPLARSVRHKLRQQHGVDRGVQVLLSTERPRCQLVDNTGGGGNLSDFQVVPNFRVRTIPVLGTTPAVFGQAAAAHIITHLAGQPFVSEPVFRVVPAAVTAQLERLREREEVHFGSADGVHVDADEVGVLVREVWRGVSARAAAAGTPARPDKGLARSLEGLLLTRWDAAKPADVDNLVLLSFVEAEAHEAEAAGDVAALHRREPKFATFVEAKLDRARREFYC